VVPGDLEIADGAAHNLDPPAPAVADMAAGNDRLVEIHAVEEYARPTRVIDVTGADQHVAIALGQPDAVPHVTDQHPAQGRLHDPHEFDAIRLRMTPHNLNPLDLRHPLFLPDA